MHRFREVIRNVGLVDLGVVGVREGGGEEGFRME